jgi:flagellar P-ring protein precursor FlgI
MRKMMKLISIFLLMLCVFSQSSYAADETVRVKDLGKLKGWRDNALVGYGLVTGLAGTGDSSSNKTTRQALTNVFSQFNLSVSPDQIQSRNVAVVMVTAALPAFANEGDTLDVTVTSVGDSRSLLGGSLLLTPLKGPNGRVYALSQGALSVGGYRYDANGNVIQKNHPTVGSIPNGATVEVGVTSDMLSPTKDIKFVLHEPDYTTAQRIATAINAQFKVDLAHAGDAASVKIHIPDRMTDNLVEFVSQMEALSVTPDRRAKVVINERTGTVVSGGDVRISKVAISHGDLKITVATQNTVSQPSFISRTGPAVQTAFVSNSQIKIDEREGSTFVGAHLTTVADLVQTLSKLKINTRDMISIMRAVKAAGALHAELIVQ